MTTATSNEPQVASSLPGSVKRAASRFHTQRARYYEYLANMLQSSKGETKLLTLFERDAERYAGKPRGILCAWWEQQLLANGGRFADALLGTLPADEVTVLRVAEDAGPGALEAGLRDVARIAMLSDRIRGEALSTMAAAVVGAAVGIGMLTIYPIFAAAKLRELFGFIPMEFWGAKGTAFIHHAENVVAFGPYVAAVLVILGAYVYWSIANFVGPTREKLDEKFALFQAIRDMKAALFLATMATLTSRRGNVMYTLAESLQTLASGARTAWLRWRIDQIATRLEVSGAVDAEVFDTNLISKEMFYFLRDIWEAQGLAEGFKETGRYVEESIAPAIARRMKVWRYVLLGIGVACVLSTTFWQMSAIYEMKDAMTNYYSSK